MPQLRSSVSLRHCSSWCAETTNARKADPTFRQRAARPSRRLHCRPPSFGSRAFVAEPAGSIPVIATTLPHHQKYRRCASIPAHTRKPRSCRDAQSLCVAQIFVDSFLNRLGNDRSGIGRSWNGIAPCVATALRHRTCRVSSSLARIAATGWRSRLLHLREMTTAPNRTILRTSPMAACNAARR
jgi:hypothetical protein